MAKPVNNRDNLLNKNILKVSDYRYERKFYITELSKHEVEYFVKMHPAIFSEIFYQRYVNNLYFDSFNFNNYHENTRGSADRIKIRIRWYNDLFGYIDKPVLEIKMKKGYMGRKISIPVKAFKLNEVTKTSDILKSISYLKELLLIDFESLIPTLLNRYSRRYYQSIDKKYRITIDDEQSFYTINKGGNSFLEQYTDNTSVILELKYNQENDMGVGHITTNFPFRITRSSKYVSGIQKFL